MNITVDCKQRPPMLRIQAAMRTLPDERQQLIRRVVDGSNLVDIAESMHLTKGEAARRVANDLRELSEVLSARQFDAGSATDQPSLSVPEEDAVIVDVTLSRAWLCVGDTASAEACARRALASCIYHGWFCRVESVYRLLDNINLEVTRPDREARFRQLAEKVAGRTQDPLMYTAPGRE
jgi:hypothetical protein